jgi:hypothetical protein
MSINKSEYIELYGADAWKEESKRRRGRRDHERDAAYEEARKGKRNDYYRERRLRLYNTKEGRAYDLAKRYRALDAEKGFDTSNNITAQWIIDNIFTQKCIYCGDADWKHLGADRIDNSKPHTPDNVVCACGICNGQRKDSYSMEDFIGYRELHPRDFDIHNLQVIEKVNGKVVIRKGVA